ncbi:PDR/VanB family oxidoreductase [Paraburkholderia sp.]|uniref:PDR/VanB family oxidoreductase n=1 Tax=Paraburkholderia sp. TaxID=1926495 RepID=UPI002D45A81F|nr:PDR/VanB family oxidoreductase [Paraburkholderia sp.]HZZ03919.1 PDR/VanB family oxidoreductase [Paraburkholderia sp.]
MSTTSEWPLELVVADTDPLTAEISSLKLKAADGGPLPAFSGGAHIKFRVDLTDGAKDPVTLPGALRTPTRGERCYSLVNSDDQSGYYEIAVKREAAGAGGSRFMHALRTGEHVRAALPTNDFPLHDEPHEAVLMAGGIGITPILSMAKELSAKGAPYRLHYAARSPETMAYRTGISHLRGEQASLYFDYGDPARGMPLAEVIGQPAPNRHLYVCGPRPLIDAVVATARAQQWSAGHVHFELFGAPTPQAGNRPCRVVLQRSGLTLDVPAEKSILDAMIDAGLDPMFDCRRGECSVCAVRVLSGTPEHHDYALSDDDRDHEHLMCVCVSRAREGELVLDA